MADRYRNFADLAADEKEELDFRIRSDERQAAAGSALVVRPGRSQDNLSRAARKIAAGGSEARRRLIRYLNRGSRIRRLVAVTTASSGTPATSAAPACQLSDPAHGPPLHPRQLPRFSCEASSRFADREQFKALEEYQSERQKDTLFETFKTPQQLGQLASRHLPSIVTEVAKSLGIETSLGVMAQAPVPKNEPLRLRADFRGEYPDNPQLWLTSSREIRLAEIEYLDEHEVKTASYRLDMQGQDFRIDISYEELLKIKKLKPRPSVEVVQVGFRLNYVDGSEWKTEKIPALLQPLSKAINNSQTYYVKLVG